MRAGFLLCLGLLGCTAGSSTSARGDDGGVPSDGGVGADPDGHLPDGAIPSDGGQLPDGAIPPDARMPPVSTDAGAPDLLSMQGVYGDFAHKTLPADAIAYDVRWPLWSDGEGKRRWVILPSAAAQIDNTDQEHWRLPIGGRLVKEFKRDGKLVETRIVERIGPNAADYSLRTYVWNAAQTEGALTTGGATNVNGTGHDVPQASDCWTCHEGEAGMALGFSAVQLPPATIAALSSAGKLRKPIAAGTAFGPTGAAAAVNALGYLHGNCGHCHNPNGFAHQFNNQTLRLDAASHGVEQEPGWLTTVGVAVQGNGLGATRRIDPGQPSNSAIVKRMSIRGEGQMPFLGTELVDPDGVSAVTTWVNSLQ